METITPNFNRIGQEIWEVRVEIHLRPQVNCDCDAAVTHEIHVFSTFCENTLILDLGQTDGHNSIYGFFL
jgi:hypothetical protein